jgi:hypothetical protein
MKLDCNNKISELFKQAEQYLIEEEYIKALFCYNSVFQLEETNHEAYFGMYITWWTYCKSIDKWSELIEDLFNNAIRNAPIEVQKKYYTIRNENSTIFYKGDKSDEQ